MPDIQGSSPTREHRPSRRAVVYMISCCTQTVSLAQEAMATRGEVGEQNARELLADAV